MTEYSFKKEAVDKFFNFFGGHGVVWFFVDGQPRLKTGPNCGQRGAPVGALFGCKWAVHHSKCAAGFERLAARLANRGKQNVDLQTRESPGAAGARLLLIDDLMEHSVGDLMTWWSGPLVVMETSPNNFQALLVSPRGLTKTEQSICQASLAKKFEGDAGATGAGQLHRFPGSPNFKGAGAASPFICKTLVQCDGEDAGFEQLNELLNDGSLDRSSTPAWRAPARRGGVATGASDNSARAFRWTVAQIKNGASYVAILDHLQNEFLAHHDPDDWPKRTLQNALFSLGIAEKRYVSKR